MAVLGRLLISSGERLDLPDLLSIDSYAAGDWSYFIKGLVGDQKPYILKGFDVIDPQNAIGTQNCSIRVAESIVFYPTSNAGAFYHGLSEGNTNALPLVPELRKNTVNYVYLTFTTANGSVDSRAFWDPDKDAGVGGEFTQDVNTESVLQVQVGVSTGSFPANTIPVCKVTVGPVVITAIQDARDMMFRLGSGGLSPDPFNQYSWRSLPSAAYERAEPPTTMVSPSNPNPFQGADKNIYSLKEWMDVVMTKLLELGGSTYWYEDISTTSLVNVFTDALATTMTSKGRWDHSSTTPGLLTWTEDLVLKGANSPKNVIIRAGTEQLQNEQVMFVTLVRDGNFNNFNQPVAWTNSQPYVNTVGGSLGLFANLKQGDWVKKKGDSDSRLLRVEQFYDGLNAGGVPTTPALARSIRLSSAYAGSTSNELGLYDKGVYENADVQITDRNDPILSQVGGDLHWLALRSDRIENIATIDSFTLSGNLFATDGETAKITVTAHGMVDGDMITVSAPAAHAGTYLIEVEDANTIVIPSTATTTGAFTATYGLATTAARDNGYGLQLESANNNFNTGDLVIIDGTVNYNGTYIVSKRSATEFQFAFATDEAAETVGTATLPDIQVRIEEGLTRIIQGESVDIGDLDTTNIKAFIGMQSATQTHPIYAVPSDYNALNGKSNFNTLATDNLTTRASKLTAMMADRVQDRETELLGRVTIRNTTNGANQDITASGTLVLKKPGSVDQIITLTSSIPANSAAVMEMARDASTAITLSIKPLGTSFLLEENSSVLFYRLSDTTVYNWQGEAIPANGTTTVGNVEDSQNKNIVISNPGRTKFNYATGAVTFSDPIDIEIIVPGSAVTNTVDVAAINALGTLILPDDSSAWVRINRVNSKVFNTTATVDSPDTDAAGTIYCTLTSLVPVDQDVVVLITRVGNTIIESKVGTPPNQNVYDESLTVVAGSPADDTEVTGPIINGQTLTLPFDSRDSSSVRQYVAGSGMLQVMLNGQDLVEGQDWQPSGATGTLSNAIIILQDLVVDDRIDFRIDTQGGVFIAGGTGGGGGGSGTLQSAYDNGRVIVVGAGQPMVLTGPSGNKLLQVNGDMDVSGVIDPQGITFSREAADPLPTTQDGLWINSSGDLIHKRYGLGDINITQAVTVAAPITLQSGHILVGNASDIATDTAVSGAVTISNTGVTTLSNGVVTDANISSIAAIDASKIAGGSVSNAEFQYLDGVTGPIQTQIDTNSTNIATETARALAAEQDNADAIAAETARALAAEAAIASQVGSVDASTVPFETLAPQNWDSTTIPGYTPDADDDFVYNFDDNAEVPDYSSFTNPGDNSKRLYFQDTAGGGYGPAVGYLKLADLNSAQTNIGAGSTLNEFTIETKVRFDSPTFKNATTNFDIMSFTDTSTGGWKLSYLASNSSLTFSVSGMSPTSLVTSDITAMFDGQWHSIVVNRVLDSLSVYLDGTQVGNTTYADAIDQVDRLVVGGPVADPLAGGMSFEDIRISTVARYPDTANISPISSLTGDVIAPASKFVSLALDELAQKTVDLRTDMTAAEGRLDAVEAKNIEQDNRLTATETVANAAIPLVQKGAANGVAPLDGNSLIPSQYLPSYVDDVLEFANLAAFPDPGETGKIYVALDTNKSYRWGGSTYVEISASEVNSVNGQIGIVVLDTDDVAEGTSNLYFTTARARASFSAADSATVHTEINSGVITSNVIDSSIGTTQLTNLGVTTAKIADNAVTGAKMRLTSSEFLRSRNAGNTLDVNLVGLDSGGFFANMPNGLITPQVGRNGDSPNIWASRITGRGANASLRSGSVTSGSNRITSAGSFSTGLAAVGDYIYNTTDGTLTIIAIDPAGNYADVAKDGVVYNFSTTNASYIFTVSPTFFVTSEIVNSQFSTSVTVTSANTTTALAKSGMLKLTTGDAAGLNGGSGNIVIQTGTSATASLRGTISLDARNISLSATAGTLTLDASVISAANNYISNLATDPALTDNLQAVNVQALKAYVSSSVTQSLTFYRAGSQSVGSGTKSQVITFSSALSNLNYAESVIMVNTATGTPQYQPLTITNKTINGFTVSWDQPTDSGSYVLDYTALPYN